GRKIAFVSYTSPLAESPTAPFGTTDIYVVRSDGSDREQLTDDDQSDDLSPVWAPQGDRIAFDRYPRLQNGEDGPYADIWTVDARSRETVHLTHDQDDLNGDENPVWSPDGALIAYSLTNDGYENVSVMQADGTQAKRVSSGWLSRNPSWSPDGRRIAYEHFDSTGTASDISVARSDGDHRHVITDLPFPLFYPQWSSC
ncbi:MAG: TolB family protein, partial [Actinomycetota bacterium]